VLPADVLADLQAAFGREVSRRLPRLMRAIDALAAAEPGTTGPAARAVVCEVHALGSSAALVGAEAAARAARECELLLVGCTDDVPEEIAGKATALARAVVRALSRWLPAPPVTTTLPSQRPTPGAGATA
jgi:HPt (histidine-containing phosphotransfer) domain-containing protein